MPTLIIDGVRTPIGKYLGQLATLSAPQLGSLALQKLLERTGVGANDVDEVILGCVLQAGVGQNPARQAALHAGLPAQVPAWTVNKVCGSGLQAILLADRAIRAGDADCLLAGGMESMSQAPYLLRNVRKGWKYGDQQAIDAMIHDGLWCAWERRSMGLLAEETAQRWHISRSDQDQFAEQSHRRAAQAQKNHLFAKEIVPVRICRQEGILEVCHDEGIRPDTTVEALAQLKPAFADNGTVTAGNASMLSDGAAAVLVCSEDFARGHNLRAKVRLAASAVVAVEPRDLFIAPVVAIRKLLDRTGLRMSDVELFEINEAFAAQMVACIRELQLDRECVNIHGGAIALGHPIGASGARVLVTLLHALETHGLRRGIAALCLGGGGAVACLIERT